MDDAAKKARDEWLALRCQLGEPAAFAELVRELERPLLYYVAKLIGGEDQAFDILQEVWLATFRTIRRLADPGALRAWVYRIAHGLAVDRVRKDRSRRRAELVQAESSVQGEEDPSFDEEDAAALHRALDTLDEKHREVLVLHFLEGFAVAEIAAVVSCPEGTVKSRLYYAKRALKEALQRGRHDKQK
jgi:RNA polymerase sigma-70 factor (ECF subfamily)